MSDQIFSHEWIVGQIVEQVGSNPSVQQVFAAVELLPLDIQTTLRCSTSISFPLSVENDIPPSNMQVERTVAEDKTSYNNNAMMAARAIRMIDSTFNDLTRRLSGIDSTYPDQDPLCPNLGKLHQTFRRIVNRSTRLAVQVSTYAFAYEKQIEVCHNINYSVDARLKSINEYIGMGKQFGEEMEEITELFEQLKGQFAAFIGTFDGWSCGKETRLREQLPDLESELQDLETQLEGHHDSCWAHLGKALLSALIEAAGCQGLPSSPWFLLIIVPTCAIAGYQAVRIGIELWKIYRTKQQIEQKEQEIDEADKVRAARRLLKDLGKESGESFRKYVQKPLGLWTEAANDAMQIKQWLEMGANQIEISEGVRSHTQETVKAYKRMARYLRVYADNVRSDNPVGRIDLAQCSVVDYAHHILPARVFEDKRNTIAEHNAISGPSTLKV